MPLVLAPMVGAEQVVPIIALAGMLTNTGRTLAFIRFVDWHRVRLVMIGAVPPCLVTAYGFTLLRRKVVLHSRGLVLGAAGYGAAVGGTVGAGVILLSLLMSAGLAGQAVI